MHVISTQLMTLGWSYSLIGGCWVTFSLNIYKTTIKLNIQVAMCVRACLPAYVRACMCVRLCLCVCVCVVHYPTSDQLRRLYIAIGLLYGQYVL